MKIFKNIVITLFVIFTFVLNAYCVSPEDLTCLELKTVMSNNFDSANVIEYFYLDSKNNVIYTEDLKPVTEVSTFNNKWIKFKNITEGTNTDKGYTFIKLYEINRYTGSVNKKTYISADSLGTKINDILTFGDTMRCSATGTGIARKVNKPTKQF